MDIKDYLLFLSELCQALDSLTVLEQRKLSAVQAGNLEELDACMKQEQVAALDLRGREQKRTAMLGELGLEQVSLRDLAGHCPDQHRAQASETIQQILRSYQVLSSAQNAARTVMESNLRHIQQELERRETLRQGHLAGPHTPQTDFRA